MSTIVASVEGHGSSRRIVAVSDIKPGHTASAVLGMGVAEKRALLLGISKLTQALRDWGSVSEAATYVGEALFNALLGPPAVEALYRDVLQAARAGRGQGHATPAVRLLLRLGEDLSSLPWELMYDPLEGTFLSTSGRVHITRLVGPDSPQIGTDKPVLFEATDVRPPLHVLAIAPAPSLCTSADSGWFRPNNGDTLGFSRALDRLCLGRAGLVNCTLLAGQEATARNLRKALQSDYDVFYYVGHSEPAGDHDCALMLEEGSRPRLGAWVLGSLVRDWLRDSPVRIAVFSSCSSAPLAFACAHSGTTDAAVGMQMDVGILAGAVFDEALIDGLAAWQSLDRCMAAGRSGMLDALTRQVMETVKYGTEDDPLERPAWHIADRVDWALPTVYHRAHAHHPAFCTVPARSYRIGLSKPDLQKIARELGWGDDLPDAYRKLLRLPEIVPTNGFRISRWPVTNHQYVYYLRQTSRLHSLPPGFVRTGDDVELDGLDPAAPVVGVTCEEAESYCLWLDARLPTADEWEMAARGPDSSRFPWGKSFDEVRCGPVGRGSKRPQSVLALPAGASLLGVEDLCGNASEWTSTPHGQTDKRLTVGGSFASPAILALPSMRFPRDPGRRDPADVGFRCVIDL